MSKLIRILPVSWQCRFWAWKCSQKIDAIRGLRASARLPLKDAKTMLDPYFPYRSTPHE